MYISTARLHIARLTTGDASFMLELAGDPDWLRYIGDRGIRDLDSARDWIESGPLASYREHGYGLYRLALKQDDRAIGICGLLQRAQQPGPEIGFALLPAFRGRGLAREAARAVLTQALHELGITQVMAILTPDNFASRKLLQKLGFVRVHDQRQENGARNPLDRYRIDPWP